MTFFAKEMTAWRGQHARHDRHARGDDSFGNIWKPKRHSIVRGAGHDGVSTENECGTVIGSEHGARDGAKDKDNDNAVSSLYTKL